MIIFTFADKGPYSYCFVTMYGMLLLENMIFFQKIVMVLYKFVIDTDESHVSALFKEEWAT